MDPTSTAGMETNTARRDIKSGFPEGVPADARAGARAAKTGVAHMAAMAVVVGAEANGMRGQQRTKDNWRRKAKAESKTLRDLASSLPRWHSHHLQHFALCLRPPLFLLPISSARRRTTGVCRGGLFGARRRVL